MRFWCLFRGNDGWFFGAEVRDEEFDSPSLSDRDGDDDDDDDVVDDGDDNDNDSDTSSWSLASDDSLRRAKENLASRLEQLLTERRAMLTVREEGGRAAANVEAEVAQAEVADAAGLDVSEVSGISEASGSSEDLPMPARKRPKLEPRLSSDSSSDSSVRYLYTENYDPDSDDSTINWKGIFASQPTTSDDLAEEEDEEFRAFRRGSSSEEEIPECMLVSGSSEDSDGVV
ncbi:PREDICTED: transcription initiation factor TFIID subunit 11-like [Cyphomyrmex costatus]|uniref:transcription initiation factor TFIID subunit 11-like n=1 Tax=Cyphomyrmex costatus TaxID=456900 RepID=UPI0008522631|nr:PREDICTED: transcription initiation factor TFIID subunit 11-like [Cyphomyrmex costatus]